MELIRTAVPAASAAPVAPHAPVAIGSDRTSGGRTEPAELTGSFAGRPVWQINCGDVINRERCLTVLVERNRVVLVGPPGETAVLNAGQLGQLRAALREAAEQAERSR